jgi:hypothetical protein
VDERRKAVERAILVEALTGATRTELWLAARMASRFVTTDQVDQVVNKLLATGHLRQTANRWTTTTKGRARLDRSTA